MSGTAMEWLLEESNPAVQYRTRIELLDQLADVGKAKDWIYLHLPENWYETKGLWYTYYVTALAECGLTKADIPNEHLTRAILDIQNSYEHGCADFMLLRALMKLGFCEHTAVKGVIDRFESDRLPDGGYLCQRRLKGFRHTPKSCYKANIHALLFLSECCKQGIDVSFGQPLIEYFFNRNLFYKSTDKTAIILYDEGKYSILSTFHPFEPMRIGIHNVVESFSSLGYENDERLKSAWEFLNKYKSDDGKMILGSTLTKSYLPKEKVGQPSKWVTFYTMLAEKNYYLTR